MLLVVALTVSETANAQIQQLTSISYGKENIGTPNGNPCVGNTRRKCAVIFTNVVDKFTLGSVVKYDCYEYVESADGTPVREGEKEYIVPVGLSLADYLLSEMQMKNMAGEVRDNSVTAYDDGYIRQ